MNITLWILQGFLAVIFFIAGAIKVINSKAFHPLVPIVQHI